jgi:hypothetical protein
MKIRVTDAPAGLVRVQIDEHVCYVRPKDRSAMDDGRRSHGHADGIMPLFHAEEPVFEVDGCQVFVHPYADRTEVIVVKRIPRALGRVRGLTGPEVAKL